MSQQSEQAVQKLDQLKHDLAELEGVGKDAILRVHGAIDQAIAEIESLYAEQHHDLNDELAASPEDHPREQGNETPTVAEQHVDDDANQRSDTKVDPSAEERRINPTLAAQTEPEQEKPAEGVAEQPAVERDDSESHPSV